MVLFAVATAPAEDGVARSLNPSAECSQPYDAGVHCARADLVDVGLQLGLQPRQLPVRVRTPTLHAR